MKDEVIKVRVGTPLKEAIRKKSNGNMSDYLRDLAVRDLDVEFEEINE